MKKWYDTLYTYIWVFNVGRGLAIFIRLPQNYGIVYDMGASDDFSPRDFIATHILPNLTQYKDEKGEKRAVAQIILSHPHADHIYEIAGNDSCHDAALWTCPHDKEYPPGPRKEYEDERVDFERVTNPDGSEDLIEEYRQAYEDRSLPLQTIKRGEARVPNVEYGIYYVRPPECDKMHPDSDQDYTNSTSLVLYLRHGKQNILLPGDITPASLERVLACDKGVERRYTFFTEGLGCEDDHCKTGDQPVLGETLQNCGLSILIAPHHGLESGYCEELQNHVSGGKPDLNVISEKRHIVEGEGTVDPRYSGEEGSSGLTVDIEGTEKFRRSISTRDGHHILIVFKGTDGYPHVYLRKDAEDLVNIVP
ncbi:MBL fold metallo-hydrolase [Candidatus Bipolaricaulota bacterium]|nr:MBL fold metallo-hydrolase [Candidatus Bipolaricaulota bacterium]